MVKRHHRPRQQYYEPFETSVLLSHIKPGDTVVDIGANHGQYTLPFLNAVGTTGRVFAFEPYPANFQRLQLHTASDQRNNLVLELKAVSNRPGHATLYLNSRNPGDHRIFYSGSDRQAIEVEVVTLSDYFKDYTGSVSLIKMDIQGAEASALEGMTDLIKKNPAIVIASEFWPYGLTMASVSPAAYLRIYLELSFKLFDIREDIKSLVRIENVDILLDKYPPDSQRYTNILALR